MSFDYPLHRWEYDPDWCLHECVALMAGIPSKDRCSGCGTIVADEELARFWNYQDPGVCLSASLDWIANRRNRSTGLERAWEYEKDRSRHDLL